MQEDKKLIYGKIEVDGRCLDLLFTEVEVARANKRACGDNNAAAQSGETVQIAMNPVTTPYTATVIIEGVLY